MLIMTHRMFGQIHEYFNWIKELSNQQSFRVNRILVCWFFFLYLKVLFKIIGFPPDDCSTEGQNWNMPIYDWNNKSVQNEVFNWWIKRLKKTLEIVDVVRIDHFRGLESYWAIPVDKEFVPLKPKYGQWMKAP